MDGSVQQQQKASRQTIRLGTVDESDHLKNLLHREAVTGTRKTLKKILSDTKFKFVDSLNNLGQTALFCACASNNEGTALLLLESGANPNEKSKDGMTPLHAVCFRGNICLLDKLIDAGGDLRLHDNQGCGMRDWAARNPDVKKNRKMIEFLDQSHILALSYTDTSSLDYFSRVSRRSNKKSLLKKVSSRRSSLEGAESLKQVQNIGFGKMYIGSDQTRGGLMTFIPLINETELFLSSATCFDCGFNTHMQQFEWLTTPVSVKQVKPDSQSKDGVDLLIADAEQLGKLRHPNILLMMGVCQQTSEELKVVCERVSIGTLYHLLHETQEQKLMPSDKLCIAQQTCAALEFIQNQKMIHCGLSSMAVYLLSTRHAKIGNFEFMVEWSKSQLGKVSAVTQVSYRGFLYNWMSPELMQAQVPSYTADVYSFCSILWELYSEQIPWSGCDTVEIFKHVVVEKKSLELDQYNLHPKLVAILGYGLELQEDKRLNKFSAILNCLKTDNSQITKNQTSDVLRDNCDSAEVETYFTEEVQLRNKKGKKWIKRSCPTYEPLKSSEESRNSAPTLNNIAYGPKDMKVSDNGKISVRPASHRNSGGNVWDNYRAHTRNNNGQTGSGTQQATLCRSTSQPQLLRTDTAKASSSQSSLASRPYSVRQIAKGFQEQMQTHSLRQSILKGSMAPGGRTMSDMDISISSDGNKIEAEKIKEGHQEGCSTSSDGDRSLPSVSLPSNCVTTSTPKFANQLCQTISKTKDGSPLSSIRAASPTGLDNLTPNRKVSPERRKTLSSTKKSAIFNNPLNKAQRDVVAEDCDRENGKAAGLDITPTAIPTVTKARKSRYPLTAVAGVVDGVGDGVLYQSPTVEYSHNRDNKDCDNSFLAPNQQTQQSNVSHLNDKDIDHCLQSLPHFSLEDKIASVPPPSLNLHENDSFWDLPGKKSEGNNLSDENDICVSGKPSYNCGDKSTPLARGEQEKTKVDLPSTHCERMSKYFQDFNNRKMTPSPQAALVSPQTPVVEQSPPDMSTVADGQSEDGDNEMNSFTSDGTFTVEVHHTNNTISDQQGTKKCPIDADDLDSVDRWVNNQLVKIERKMNLKSKKSGKEAVVKQTSPLSTVLHTDVSGREEINKSPTSRTGRDEVKSVRASTGGCGDTHLLKIDSAKSVTEADGCEFEFQEFYIEDDFDDSSERIEATDLDSNPLTGVQCGSKSPGCHAGRHTANTPEVKPQTEQSTGKLSHTSDVNVENDHVDGNCETDGRSIRNETVVIEEGSQYRQKVPPRKMFHARKNKGVEFTGAVKDNNEHLGSEEILRQRRNILEKSRHPTGASQKVVDHLKPKPYFVEDIEKVSNMLEKCSIEGYKSHVRGGSGKISGKSNEVKTKEAEKPIPTITIQSCSSNDVIDVQEETAKEKRGNVTGVHMQSNSRNGEFSDATSKTNSVKVFEQNFGEVSHQDSVGINRSNQQVSKNTNSKDEVFIPKSNDYPKVGKDDSSSDSDPWVKKNLKRIKQKIMHQRSREKNYASSDDNMGQQDELTFVTNISSTTSSKNIVAFNCGSNNTANAAPQPDVTNLRAVQEDIPFVGNSNKKDKGDGFKKRNRRFRRRASDKNSVAEVERKSGTKIFSRNTPEKKVDDRAGCSGGQSEDVAHSDASDMKRRWLKENHSKSSVVYHNKNNTESERFNIKSQKSQRSTPVSSHKSSVHTLTRSELKENLEQTLQSQLEERENQRPWCRNTNKCSKEDPARTYKSDDISDTGTAFSNMKQTLTEKPPRKPRRTPPRKKTHFVKPARKTYSKEPSSSRIGFEGIVDKYDDLDSTDYHIGFEKVEEDWRGVSTSNRGSSDHMYPVLPVAQGDEHLSYLESGPCRKYHKSGYEQTIQNVDGCEKRLPMTQLSNLSVCDNLQTPADGDTMGRKLTPRESSGSGVDLVEHGGGEPSKDHCLTVGLWNQEPQSQKHKDVKQRKRSGFGLQRFYIPKDKWPEGSKAKLNVQIDPKNPMVHRVTGRTEDPTTGHSELLIDETLITSKLKSTMQVD